MATANDERQHGGNNAAPIGGEPSATKRQAVISLPSSAISLAGSTADDGLYKALSHRVRRAILIELGKGEPLAATQLATRFGMDPDVDGTSEVSYHLGKLAGFGYVEEAGRQKGKRSAYLCFYRLKPEYEDIVSTLAQRGDAVTVTAVSNLERPASSNVLETIARCLGADGSPYDSLTAIADIIRGEGVSVTLPGEEPAEDAALTPEKLGQMKRLNLRRGECGCPTPIADGDGHCVNCTKPITRVAA